jgi:hypothetical protein
MPRHRPQDHELVALVGWMARAAGGSVADGFAGADTGDVALRRLKDGYGALQLAAFAGRTLGLDCTALQLGSSSGVGAGLGAAEERVAA